MYVYVYVFVLLAYSLSSSFSYRLQLNFYLITKFTAFYNTYPSVTKWFIQGIELHAWGWLGNMNHGKKEFQG